MQKHLKRKKEKVWTECRNHNNILLLYCTCPLYYTTNVFKKCYGCGGWGWGGRSGRERRGSWVLFCADEAVSFVLHVVCVFLKQKKNNPERRLGDAGAADAGGAHLREHLVQPLQGAVQVQLDPAGGAGHRLPPGRAEPDVRGKQKWGGTGTGAGFWDKQAQEVKSAVVILGVDHRFGKATEKQKSRPHPSRGDAGADVSNQEGERARIPSGCGAFIGQHGRSPSAGRGALSSAAQHQRSPFQTYQTEGLD